MKKNTHFAKSKSGKIIEAKKGMTDPSPFYCLGCEKEVIACAVFTKKQRTHFRHLKKIDGDGGCGESESYIHNLSKEKFAENYRNISTFKLYREVTLACVQAKYPSCKKNTTETLNLKEIYPYIKVEKKDGRFIPDCLLYNDKNEKIYIEIKYTSSISDAKKNSGVPIIEIAVQEELDIDETLKNNSIKESNKSIKLFNFNSIPINTTYDCKGICPEEAKRIEKEKLLQEKKIKKERLQRFQEAKKNYTEKKENTPIVNKEKYEIPHPTKRKKIIGTQSVELLKPKKCLQCNSNTTHYMNVGRVIINEEYKILSQDKEPFKDESTVSERFSIAKRKPNGKTNTYYCPDCKKRIAEARFLADSGRKVYEDEEIIIGQIGLF